MLNHNHPELKDAMYVVFVDASRRYVDCSAEGAGLLGYTRQEMLQKTIDTVSYDANVQELFKRYLQNRGLSGEYILQHKDRTPVPVRYKAFVFEDGCKAAIWEPIKDWRASYFAALLEVEPQKQKGKIEEALTAIRRSRGPKGPDAKDLNDAEVMLNTLRKRAK